MAAVLSWEARNDAIAAGISGEHETVFKRDDLDYWQTLSAGGNRYLIVAAANEKKSSPTYTCAAVIELRQDRTYLVVDLLRAELNTTERLDLLFNWHRDYDPVRVGYEARGLEADQKHIADRKARENHRFFIDPLESKLTENERIMRLVPIAEGRRLILPEKCEHDGVDMVTVFRDQELTPYPFAPHCDLLDLVSRILDMPTVFPTKAGKPRPTVFPSDF